MSPVLGYLFALSGKKLAYYLVGNDVILFCFVNKPSFLAKARSFWQVILVRSKIHRCHCRKPVLINGYEIEENACLQQPDVLKSRICRATAKQIVVADLPLLYGGRIPMAKRTFTLATPTEDEKSAIAG